MKTTITKIGNSKGLIIPAQILKQCGFEKEVCLSVKNSTLVISPAQKPRAGWEEAILAEGADDLVLPETGNDFDKEEWTW